MENAKRHRLERYLDRLFGFAVSLAGEREVARELVQDCAVKALSARRVPVDEPAYRAWLFRILRNRFIDRLRQRERRPPLLALDDDGAADIADLRPFAGGPGDQPLINTLTVRLAMERLSSREREILALIDIAGLTYGEAAAVLDVPPGTVMSRISRARHALLVVLDESNIRAFPQHASTSKGSGA